MPTCAAVLHQLKLAIRRHKGHHLRHQENETQGEGWVGQAWRRGRHGGAAHVVWLAVHYPTAAKQARGAGNASTRPRAEQASGPASPAVWRPARSGGQALNAAPLCFRTFSALKRPRLTQGWNVTSCWEQERGEEASGLVACGIQALF